MAVFLIWVAGCGGSGGGGSNSNSSTDQSRHPSDHQTAFLSNPDLCVGCHGVDLRGGEVGVSCFSENYDVISCHASGPNSHPSGWADPNQHGAAAKAAPGIRSGFSYCQKCHGQDFSGGFIDVSCFTCHIESVESGHPVSWTGFAIYLNHGNYVVTNGTAQCANQYCHGESLTGSTGSGPSCNTCHTWPYTPCSADCSFCHDYPPSGTQYPNIAGKHVEHMALPNVECSSCHSDAGCGTAKHYDGTVEVSFAPEFNSKSGTASFNTTSKTCSNISCHGGPRTQTYVEAFDLVSYQAQTPDWLNGTIDVDAQCTSCHVSGPNAQDPEYNSYYSGQHRLHVLWMYSCIECHDASMLSISHFTNLNTREISGAADTIKTDLQYVNWGFCAANCHI